MALSFFRRATDSTPAPIVYGPSGLWKGNDGSWSTFELRVGTPLQSFQVMASTASPDIWVPTANGSSGFQASASSTWKDLGFSTLTLDSGLGYSGNATFGSDSVALQESGSPSLEGQTVAAIDSDDFAYGVFGLDPRASNSTAATAGRKTLMQSLKDQDLIPSLSYGYTAGAPYENNETAAGSLTLGGYDQSRFTASGYDIPFNDDATRSLTAGVQMILGQNTFVGSVTFNSQGYWGLIDSTVPHIWMPEKACDLFEQTLKLDYDKSTDLYLVNSSVREQLLQLNPTFSFKISPWIYGGNITEINLPYASFDMQVSKPYYETPTYYFPIRRAQNDSQLVLGRSFLQQAYLVVDYEREVFSVNQVNFSNPMPARNIVSIMPPATNTTVPRGSGFSTKATAGISVGAAVVAIAILALLVALWRRKRKQPRPDEKTPMPPPYVAASELPHVESARYEAVADAYYRTELSGAPASHELHGGTPPWHELHGEPPKAHADSFPHELPGDLRYQRQRPFNFQL